MDISCNLDNLNTYQIYSLEILIDRIQINHGKFKNSGRQDESESEDEPLTPPKGASHQQTGTPKTASKPAGSKAVAFHKPQTAIEKPKKVKKPKDEISKEEIPKDDSPKEEPPSVKEKVKKDKKMKKEKKDKKEKVEEVEETKEKKEESKEKKEKKKQKKEEKKNKTEKKPKKHKVEEKNERNEEECIFFPIDPWPYGYNINSKAYFNWDQTEEKTSTAGTEKSSTSKRKINNKKHTKSGTDTEVTDDKESDDESNEEEEKKVTRTKKKPKRQTTDTDDTDTEGKDKRKKSDTSTGMEETTGNETDTSGGGVKSKKKGGSYNKKNIDTEDTTDNEVEHKKSKKEKKSKTAETRSSKNDVDTEGTTDNEEEGDRKKSKKDKKSKLIEKENSKNDKLKGDIGSKKGKDKKQNKKKIAASKQSQLAIKSSDMAMRKRYRRPRPPIKYPLPPIRISVSMFHLKNVHINQVDLEKLYPPSPSPLSDDSDTEAVNNLLQEKKMRSKVKINTTGNVTKLIPSKHSTIKHHESRKSSGGKSSSKRASREVSEKKIKSHSLGSVDHSNTSKGVIASELKKALNQIASCEHKTTLNLDNKEETINTDRAAKKLLKKIEREKRQREKSRRQEIIARLVRCEEFKRGFSCVFTSTPFCIMTSLLKSNLVLQVERSDLKGPSYYVGKTSITLPPIYGDMVQRAAIINSQCSMDQQQLPLWTCTDDIYPIISEKGKRIGMVWVYICLTCLGTGLTSSHLVTQTGLYKFINTGKPLTAMPKNDCTILAKCCLPELQNFNGNNRNLNQSPHTTTLPVSRV